MEYSQENLQRILDQRELTIEQRQWLVDYLEQSDGEELKNLLKEYFNQEVESNRSLAPFTSENLIQNIHQHLDFTPRSAKIRNLNKSIIWLAASFIGIVLFVSIFLVNKKREVRPFAQNNNAKVVSPGKDGAILTLSNGTTIVLDSAHNGPLTVDKGANIVKDGSRIIYNSNGATNEVTCNTIATPNGRQFQLMLADGSKVWLNAASSIRFPTAFIGKTRNVEVTGEAYFEVAKNPSMPFKVKANGTEVEVLGTHFNINAYDNLTKTTLLEGSVRIQVGSSKNMLKPGQQAQTTGDGNIRIQNNVDLEQVVAWKNGRFQFEDASIQFIMAQIARWYDVDVVYEGKVPQRTFSADISRTTELKDFLKVLKESGVHFRLEGKILTVLK